MAHDLTINNGKAEFAYLDYKTPWHGLGEAVPTDRVVGVSEFIDIAGVRWGVEKDQLATSKMGILIPDSFALIRDDNMTILGTTGKGYTSFDHVPAIEQISDRFGIKLDTLGSLHGGESVFALFQLDDVNVGSEKLENYLLARFGHDGKTPVDLKKTAVRVVCRNTQDMAMAGKGMAWSARHTEKVQERWDAMLDEFESSFNGQDEKNLAAEIERLMNEPLHDNTAQRILDEVFPAKDGNSINTEAWAVRGLYEQHPTVRDANGTDLKGTQWGLYQATSFYDLWTKDVRGEDRLVKQAFATLDDNPTPNARKVHKLLVG